jgi:hypothetical protein
MDLIAGGYFVVGRGEAPPREGRALLPPWLWTPTSCLCDLYPDFWAFSWAQYEHADAEVALARLGLGASDLASVQAWVEQRSHDGRLSFANVFDDLDSARDFVARFARRHDAIKILGVGLTQQDVAAFFEETRDEYRNGHTGFIACCLAGWRCRVGLPSALNRLALRLVATFIASSAMGSRRTTVGGSGWS